MKTSIIVQNLKCGGCVKTITSKLATLPNISNLEVNQETATVSFIATQAIDALAVKNKLKDLGYPSIDQDNSTFTKAKSFMSCATGKIR
jgi:copper chaperone CopZ